MQGAAVVSNPTVGMAGHCIDSSPNFGRKLQNFSLNSKTQLPIKSVKLLYSASAPIGVGHFNWAKKNRKIRVRAVANESEEHRKIAPLKLESPTGQLLSQLLNDNPYLLPAAAEHQLERLVADRDADSENEQPKAESKPGTDVVLYRRIAELKATERRKALEEIIYALIVQRFLEAGANLIPSISNPDPHTGKVDTWPNESQKLEKVHSSDALEMISNHLNIVLGNRVLDSKVIAQIGKMRLGHVYTASVMYGYFLRRVDQRFQLEKSMKLLPPGLNEELGGGQQFSSFLKGGVSNIEDNSTYNVETMPSDSNFNAAYVGGIRVKPCKLRSYVMSFDQDTLQRHATMRSKEGLTIIENHAEALFGKPEIQLVSGNIATVSDEMIRISISGLKSMVMEAITFGCFLWDVESYVDSKYQFLAN